MKIKEKFQEFVNLPDAEEYFILCQVSSFIDFMETAILELDDYEVTSKFEELQHLMYLKRRKMAEVEV